MGVCVLYYICAGWITPSTEENLGCWHSRTFFPRSKRGTSSSRSTWRMPTSTSRWFRGTGSSSGLPSGKGLAMFKVLSFGLALAPRMFTKSHVFGGLSGLNLDAGPSGPCSGRKHPIVLGPLQARSSRVCSFPISSLGAAPYEAIPLVDEVPGYSWVRVRVGKSVRHLSPRHLSVTGPQFSPERSAYGGSLLSPNNNDGRFPLRVGGRLAVSGQASTSPDK